MTRKHFEKIAGVMLNTMAKRETCEDLAAYFAELSPRFDRERFMAACGWAGC